MRINGWSSITAVCVRFAEQVMCSEVANDFVVTSLHMCTELCDR